MSKDDSSSGSPARRNDEEPMAPPPPEKRREPFLSNDIDEEETDLARTTLSPALRLMAWLVALVILLAILGWALGGGQ